MTGDRLAILTEPCGDCPFAGRFPHLRSGRLKDILSECRERDSYFVCHKTVDYNAGDDDENEDDYGLGADAVNGPAAVCAGFLRAFEPTIVQVATRLNLVDWREPIGAPRSTSEG